MLLTSLVGFRSGRRQCLSFFYSGDGCRPMSLGVCPRLVVLCLRARAIFGRPRDCDEAIEFMCVVQAIAATLLLAALSF
jgi:hypothetical protein